MTTFYFYPTDGSGTLVWNSPYNWSLSPTTYTNPNKEFPAAGDDVIVGGNIVTGGSANDLTGGFNLLGAAITDVNAAIPASSGVLIDHGGVWTNSSSLDDEALINVADGSQLSDDGSDTIGLTNTSGELDVTGAGSSYSASFVIDDGNIDTFQGGSVTIASLTGTGDLAIGLDGAGGSTGQIGSVSIPSVSVGSGSSLTAGAATVNTFQAVGTASVSSLDLTGLGTYQYLTVDSSGSFTDSGGLRFGDGTVSITDDGTFTLGGGGLVLGGVAGDSVSFFLDGTFNYAGSLAIGTAGDGTFQVSTSYTVNNSLTLGSASTGFGAILATGNSADLTVAGSLTVGAAGGGVAQADLGGTLTVQSLIVATAATAATDYYDILANGTSSLFDVIGDATIGAVGAGSAEVESGGTFAVGGTAVFGAALGASGRLMVTGGLWRSGGTLDVGLLGFGKVQVIANTMAPAAVDAAAVEVNNGSVQIYGTNSTLNSLGDLEVGAGGDATQATLDIQAGASATAVAMGVDARSTSGTAPGADSVTVDGTGSALTISNSVTVGSALPTATNGNGDPDGTDGVWTYTNSGIGQISVSDGGYMSIGQTLTLQDPSSDQGLTIDGGGGVETGGDGGLTADTLRVDANGLIIGHGRINGTVTGTVEVSDTTTAPTWSLKIVNNGKIEANNGTLLLDGNLSGDGQVLIGPNSTLEIGGTVADNVTAMFLPGGGREIIIDDPIDFKGTISSENFEPGDAIDLPNMPYIDPGSADLNPDGASFYFETGQGQQTYVLQVVENEQTYDIPINKDAPLTGGFTLTADGHGGTLITYSADPVTGYSVTATADGNPDQVYSGVVHVYAGVHDAGGKLISSGQGSAFAVGQHLILTAMHVVLPDLQKGGFVSVVLGPNQFAFGFVTAHGQNNGNVGPNDWAYVYVPKADFSVPQWFPLNKSFPGGKVILAGYPGIVNGNTVNDGSQSHQYNYFETITPYGGGLYEGPIPFASGISGGVAFTVGADGAKAVGIIDSTNIITNKGYILSAANIKDPPPPAAFYTDPPSNAARITSAVVVETGGVDTAQTVQFVLILSANVVVTGSGPTLSLNDGGVAIYNTANSTGTELEFDYTVGAGDQTSKLEITGVDSTDTVQAPGGGGIDFSVLNDQPTDLSINSPLVVTAVASSQTGEASAGQRVQLTLAISEGVTVNAAGGAPTLLLNDNATATYDATASNASAGTLVFDYTVGSGDETANLEIASVDLPTGTTVQNTAGYNADFTAAINTPAGLQIGPAYITAITPSQTIDLTTGQTLRLTLAMSQGVTLNTAGGSPTLSLSDGATATYDAAASSPSAGNLVFDDTAGSGDYTTDLQLLTYKANGATVTDAHGVNADLSGVTQFDLALDVNAVTVTNLTVSPATGEADSGQTVTLTLTLSEPVTVNLTGGSPALNLNDGVTATYDGAASSPSTGTLVFAYKVGAGDETPSLQVGQVNLDGAAIDDASGNAADLSAASNFTTSLQIGPAFVTSITPSLTGEIFTGQTDQFTLALSQGVTVNTTGGSPMLSLSDGASATYDTAASDPFTGALVFDDTVGASDYTTGLSVLGYNPDGATVTDANGVDADFSGVAGFDLGLDVNAATVTAVTSLPSSGEADSGARITVTLTMSEAVTVDTANGAPVLNLGIGANATYDSAASDPSSGTLVFDDTVGATDETPDLQVIQVKLNGATIDDATGDAADLSAASSFDTGLQIGPVFVDQVTPSLSGDITSSQTLQLAVAMSAGLTVDTDNGLPALRLSDGATATYDSAGSDPSAGTLLFDYTAGGSDYASGLSVAGIIANGATITDANGISPDFSGLAQSYLGLDVNAATVTNVTASSSSGDALSGQQVLLTLTTNEPLTVDMTGGSPKLDLSDGAIATFDSAASNPAAGALAFAYTVGATDEDPNLQIAKVNLNGASINDSNGNAADLSAATTIATDLQIGPRVMVWTGSSDSSFADASNWKDITDNLAPAQTAPDPADTVEFNTSRGSVSGTGTVAVAEVGSNGNGVLQLSAGATLVAGSLDAGVVATDVGQIGLTGAGTELTVTGSATVADDGTGVLSVLAGATFAATNLTIGAQGDSSGALVVSGDGSVVQLSGALNIGTALGIGDLTVGPGAAVHASVVNLQGQVVLEGGLLDPTVQLINQGQTAGGFGTIAAGDIVDEGVIQAGGNKASQKLLLVVGTVLGGGTLTANGAQPGSNPTGVLQINAGGTMELTGPVINAATTTFTDNLTPTGTYSVNNSVVDVTFADAAGVLKLDDIAGFGGTITAHQAGDSFVITGGTLSGLNVSNGNTLTFADSGSGAGAGGIDSIIFNSAINASGFNIANGNTVQVACFAEGTRVETVNGPVAVEALLVGDRIVTAEDGSGEPVVWVGQRAVNCARHPNPETVWPVRVRTGAFGPGRPARDLYLSPDHAVFINDVLVPAKLLINGTSIAQVKRDRVMYFHVELSRHAVILAEGLSVESYLETGDRADFDHDGLMRLHPDFGRRLRPDMAMLWETKGAAPLVMTGPDLAAAHQMIAGITSGGDARSWKSVSRPG